MYYCNKCSYILDLIKDETKKNSITDIDIFFDIIEQNKNINNYNIDITLDKIKSNKKYKKLSEDKKKILNSLQYDKHNNILFNCDNCNNKISIMETMLLYEIDYTNSNNKDITKKYNYDDINLLINDPLLAHTNNYICINNKCITHKEVKKKDAVMTRYKDNYKMHYICTSCKTIWIV